jgi:hypothetical protein
VPGQRGLKPCQLCEKKPEGNLSVGGHPLSSNIDSATDMMVAELGLTLSRLGPRLDRVLSLAIHISPNNGAINTVQSGKLVVNVLAMHYEL